MSSDQEGVKPTADTTEVGPLPIDGKGPAGAPATEAAAQGQSGDQPEGEAQAPAAKEGTKKGTKKGKKKKGKGATPYVRPWWASCYLYLVLTFLGLAMFLLLQIVPALFIVLMRDGDESTFSAVAEPRRVTKADLITDDSDLLDELVQEKSTKKKVRSKPHKTQQKEE